MRLRRTTLSVLGGLGVVSGVLFAPRAYSADFALLVGSQGDGRIVRYDALTGEPINLFVAPGSGGLESGCATAPLGFLFGPDGNFYVSSGGVTSEVLRYNGDTGEFIDIFVTDGSGGLDQPSSLAFGPDGHLYVSGAESDNILRYDGTTGAFIDAFVASGVGGLEEPFALKFGPDGHLYVSSDILAASDVLRFDGETGAFMGVFALGAEFGLFENVSTLFGSDGKLYVSSAHPGKIVRYDATTGTPLDVFVSAGSGGLEDPTGMRFGPDGHLYVSEYAGDAILRYDGLTGAPFPGPLGSPGTAQFFPPRSGGLDCPWDLVFAKLPPLVCEPSGAAEAERLSLTGLPVSTKNRFLSFTAGDAGRAKAIRVTMDDLPPPFDIWNGKQMWVGSPSQVSQNGSSVVPLDGFENFTAARLQCQSVFLDWTEQGTIHVFHEAVVPGGSYTLEVIDNTCSTDVASNYSFPLVIAAAIWGDTISNLTTNPPGPPNGSIDIIDATAIIGSFVSDPLAIVKARADLEPGCLDLIINISDVTSAITGFQGLGYDEIEYYNLAEEPLVDDPCDSTCLNPLP